MNHLNQFLLVGFLVSVLGWSLQSGAEEKTCTVKGMHCQGCTEMVTGKVCGEGEVYSTCDVKVTDVKKEIGQVHLVTKDASAKIDEKALTAIIEDAGYKLEKCSVVKGKAKTTGKKG